MAALTPEMEAIVNEMKGFQKDLDTLTSNRGTLMTQLNENDLVQKELAILEDGAVVYKLIGPALVKQDLGEARSNVSKRIEFLKGEMKRVEQKLIELEKKTQEKQTTFTKLKMAAAQAQQPRSA